jgi:acetyl esterase/lipase
MDMYTDRSIRGKKPVCIWVHGGGFRFGDKRQALYVKMAERFAEAGYVSFSINYRLNTTGKIDLSVLNDAVSDVLTAIRWIGTHANEYGIDPEKIILAGDSAGGGIVVNTAYGEQGRKRVCGCIDLWGGLRFNRLDTVADRWGEPINYDPLTPDIPPTCIIHGDRDEVIPFKTASDLATGLSALGIYQELHVLEGALHYPESRADEFIPIMLRFSNKIIL